MRSLTIVKSLALLFFSISAFAEAQQSATTHPKKIHLNATIGIAVNTDYGGLNDAFFSYGLRAGYELFNLGEGSFVLGLQYQRSAFSKPGASDVRYQEFYLSPIFKGLWGPGFYFSPQIGYWSEELPDYPSLGGSGFALNAMFGYEFKITDQLSFGIEPSIGYVVEDPFIKILGMVGYNF